jgi:antitoxin component of MazEF toxin-antitoxin module
MGTEMGHKRKIRKIGNSQGIIIPKPILEEHNLDIGDYLTISCDNFRLIFAKVDGMHDKNKKVRRGSGKAR